MKCMRSQLRHSNPGISSGRRTKPKVSADYVVGLTDGEGCFYVLVRPPFNRKGGALVQLNFYIKVQERDRMLLEKIKNTLECGSVYFQHETRSNHTQCYRYTVNTHRDIFAKIIPFFEKHPLQSNSKCRSFEIFCKIAEMVRLGMHHDKKGIKQIQKLKAQMNIRTRVVREIRTLRGNSKQSQLSKSARHTKGVGSA